MAWSSTVPAAMAALVTTWRQSPDLAPPVAVRDGPEVTASSARDVVVAGWYGVEGDELAVEGQDTMEGLVGSPDREQYVIRCAAIHKSGTSGPPSAGVIAKARQRAYELLAACGAAIDADRRLGGTVMRATVGASSLRQVPDPKGITAIVEFTVEIDAYAGR